MIVLTQFTKCDFCTNHNVQANECFEDNDLVVRVPENWVSVYNELDPTGERVHACAACWAALDKGAWRKL